MSGSEGRGEERGVGGRREERGRREREGGEREREGKVENFVNWLTASLLPAKC